MRSALPSHRPVKDALISWCELAGLCALAIAQPIFVKLRDGPELLAILEIRGSDALLFVLIAVAAPPTVLWLLESAVGLIWSTGRRLVHAGFVAFLLAAMVWQAAHGDSPVENDLARGVFLVTFCVSLAAYLLTRWLPMVTRLLAFALPMVATWFLLDPQVSKSVTAEGTPNANRDGPPVVLVVFDELPLATLMGADGNIDAKLFPNFARLAREATWYPRARTVADQTIHAVPAILTGQYPVPGRVGTSGNYPQNIFTLLKGPILNGEVLTDLCTPPACDNRYPLPDRLSLLTKAGLSISNTLPFGLLDTELQAAASEMRQSGRGYPEGFDAFLAELTSRSGRPPSLAVFHELLPHQPWIYLPSGQTYTPPPPGSPEQSSNGELALTWSIPKPLIKLAFQRHVLQTQFVDRQLGRLMQTMKRAALYDDAALAVTADHGISFQAGTPLRAITPENAGWLLPVPLFVKHPGQRRGATDRSAMRTVDVLPTLARAVDAEIPEDLDGRVADESRDSRIDEHYLSHETSVRIASPNVTRALKRAVALREEMIWSGTPFTLGGATHLVGKRAGSLGVPPLQATLERKLEGVKPRAPQIDPIVRGLLPSRERAPGTRIAFALNGRFVATGDVLDVGGAPGFVTVVPVRSLRSGANRFEVYPLDDRPAATP